MMIKKITKEEIMGKINRGEKFRLIDVRDTPDYEERQISTFCQFTNKNCKYF